MSKYPSIKEIVVFLSFKIDFTFLPSSSPSNLGEAPQKGRHLCWASMNIEVHAPSASNARPVSKLASAGAEQRSAFRLDCADGSADELNHIPYPPFTASIFPQSHKPQVILGVSREQVLFHREFGNVGEQKGSGLVCDSQHGLYKRPREDPQRLGR